MGCEAEAEGEDLLLDDVELWDIGDVGEVAKLAPDCDRVTKLANLGDDFLVITIFFPKLGVFVVALETEPSGMVLLRKRLVFPAKLEDLKLAI